MSVQNPTVHEQNPLNQEIERHQHEEAESMNPKRIWHVFWVLLAITTIEFIIALYLVPHHIIPQGSFKIFIYVSLTLLKAFYIVAYFMHLKFERLTLIYTMIVPTILVVGLIAGLLTEGHHWLSLR